MAPTFVGRSDDLDELVSLLDHALAGRAGIALVAGEPGIGKTRLVTELGRLAGARTVPVLWGGCTEEDGAPAFWPWRRILRSWLALAGPDAAAARLADAAELALIAPELQLVADVRPMPEAAGPEQRFALFDAVARFFTALAADTGLVLVLDDLHWADQASVALLSHVAREAGDARILVAVTYRPAELAPERAGLVADLVRLPGGVRLQLSGLHEADVARALAERLASPPSPEVVAEVARRTGGNPFFVGELGRLLKADPEGGALRVPAAVLDVVGRRLARLPQSCRALLGPAAVIGSDLDVGLVATVVGVPLERAFDDLQPALADGVLVRPPGSAALRFAHDLVREALLDGLAQAERARIHSRVVEALEPAAGDPDVLPDLARHALAALPLGDAQVAQGWARKAGERAMAQLAYEEAARLFVRAGEAGRGVLDVPERIELHLAAAHAYSAAHDVPGAIQSCTDAAELARRAGDSVALGRAALVLPSVSEVDWLQVVRGWCEEALRGLPDADSSLRAQVLAQLTHAMLPSADAEEMASMSGAALAMAERVGDPVAVVSALRARQLALSDASGCAERLVLGGRMLTVAARTGDPGVALWGHLWRFDALLQLGRVAEAESELDRLEPVVLRQRLPLARMHLLRSRVALAFGRGRFAEARRLNDEASVIAERGQHFGALMTAASVRFSLDVFTGADVGETGWIEQVAERYLPYIALVRSSLALWHLDSARVSDAATWYARLPPPGSPRIPLFMRLPLESRRAILATGVGDAEGAEAAYRLLLPYADLHVTGGAGATTTSGSVQLYLGIGALGSGRPEVAIRHLRAAVAVDDAAGLVPFAAMARHRLAVALRLRGRPSDLDEAAGLLAEAAATGERLGAMPGLRAQVAAEATALRAGGDGVLSRRETEIARLVGRGLTNRQIGAAAHIAERTVETHVQNILAKLGFDRRTEIAAWVARRDQ
jgi:DNA-binding CsgD family transcriptional regulator